MTKRDVLLSCGHKTSLPWNESGEGRMTTCPRCGHFSMVYIVYGVSRNEPEPINEGEDLQQGRLFEGEERLRTDE